MFVELLPQVHQFEHNGKTMYLRYDNAALLELERAGIDILNPSIFHYEQPALILSGLGCYFNENSIPYESPDDEAIITRNDIIVEFIGTKDINELAEFIVSAINLALPPPVIIEDPEHKAEESKKIDLAPLKSCFCNVMGKSDSEFWGATLREVDEAWRLYGECNGFIAPVDTVTDVDEGIQF